MGGVPPTLHSHAQQVELIGVGSLTGSETYFVCTNFSAIRAPTVDVGYVPNAKYLAHIPHQTLFSPN